MKCNREYETSVKYYVLRHCRPASASSVPPSNSSSDDSNLPSTNKKAASDDRSTTVQVSTDKKSSQQAKTAKKVKNAEKSVLEPAIESVPEEKIVEVGSQLTSEGPAPYVGDILEHPELLWTEDTWTPEKEEMAKKRIEEQGGTVSPYWRQHYEAQAGRYWHQFYQRNQDHFYKDRHYIHVVFPELQANSPFYQAQVGRSQENCIRMLEVGCGVGNAVIPLLEINPCLHITAVDFAKSAIEILRKHIQEHHANDAYRFKAEVNNVAEDPLPEPESSLDIVLCMFVLSAMSKDVHIKVFKKLFSMLKPGGKLLMRDYGRFDEAQLRFKKGSKLDENFYVRQDGTCSYFFSLDEIKSIAAEVGFEVEENEYILRQYANRQQKKARYRVWIHVKLVKPL